MLMGVNLFSLISEIFLSNTSESIIKMSSFEYILLDSIL